MPNSKPHESSQHPNHGANTSPIWAPSQKRILNSHLHAFIETINRTYSETKIQNFSELHHWSIEHDELFWQEVWQYGNVIGDAGELVKTTGDSKWGRFTPNRDTVWFPFAKLNYAENLLSFYQQNPDQTAIICCDESNVRQKISGHELISQVSVVQQWLVDCGIQSGDVVAGYLPYLAQSVVAMLAATSLGAVWTSISPDFGEQSVVERFEQSKPKVIFCSTQYQFGGKHYEISEKINAILNRLDHRIRVCVINPNNQPANLNSIACCSWQQILDSYTEEKLTFQRMFFNEPLFILYSSGTTGVPKCIVHSVGGVLLNHLKEHLLHCDIKSNDRVFYYTTCGWMMWNWHISTLATGATLVIYNGSPFYPNPEILWEISEQFNITLFGTSAKYLQLLDHHGYQPNAHHNLHSLKTVCSTGSVLYPEQFDFVYQSIKDDLHLASISGGTDICGCFILGNPISPVFRGECQSPGLGIDIQILNEAGDKIVNQRGELTCCNSIPNFPLGFLNDDGQRYHNAYWDHYENIWFHGDDVLQTTNHGYLFYGRSDATINPDGIRIGTAEIYRQVNAIDGIEDSIAVGKQIDNNEKIILMVQLANDYQLTNTLKQKIRVRLKNNCSARHVPAHIIAISDIPKTRSGKSVELAVKQLVNGLTIKNKSAIVNPLVFDEIAQAIKTL